MSNPLPGRQAAVEAASDRTGRHALPRGAGISAAAAEEKWVLLPVNGARDTDGTSDTSSTSMPDLECGSCGLKISTQAGDGRCKCVCELTGELLHYCYCRRCTQGDQNDDGDDDYKTQSEDDDDDVGDYEFSQR